MFNNICVYGTYRMGQVNFKQCQKNYGINDILYLRTTTLNGYRMYDAYYYPTIEHSDDLEDTIVVDLLRVSNKIYDSLKLTQANSEFFEDIVSIDDVFYSIFIQPFVKPADRRLLVRDGNWLFANENFIC